MAPNPTLLTAAARVCLNSACGTTCLLVSSEPSAASIKAGQHWLGNLKHVPLQKVTGCQIEAHMLQGEKGWDMKRWSLPNCGIAMERKDQVHTDWSSKETWSGHQEEVVSLKIKPAYVPLIGNAYLGTRNHYHMAGAFYKIFHLLLHARLTLLHQQWHEQFSYLPVSSRLQVLVQCKRKHRSPFCQSHSTDTLNIFSSKFHTGT